MADSERRKSEDRYHIDKKHGYKPDSDPPRTPPTSDKEGDVNAGSSSSNKTSGEG